MGLVILIISHWKREAEIFAGIVLLPNAEIQKWMAYDDIMRPDVIARMSVHYQISFVRLW